MLRGTRVQLRRARALEAVARDRAYDATWYRGACEIPLPSRVAAGILPADPREGFEIWKLLSVVALGAMVIACDGDDDTSSAGSPTADVQVTLSDYAFAPDEVTVPAGAEVTITVTNTSGLPHNWVLLSAGPTITAEDARDEDDVFVNLSAVVSDRTLANVLAGSQTEQQATFLGPPAGTYQVICTLPPHLGFGMEGTLVAEG